MGKPKGEAIPRRRLGPLGPWRLALAITAAAVFTGLPLFDAATTGVGADMALLRSLGVALLTWVAVGALNRALINIPDAADAVDPARELQQ